MSIDDSLVAPKTTLSEIGLLVALASTSCQQSAPQHQSVASPPVTTAGGDRRSPPAPSEGSNDPAAQMAAYARRLPEPPDFDGTEPAPRSIAGWRLGSSQDELRDHCQSVGGRLVLARAERGLDWQCIGMSGQPAEAAGVHCGEHGTCSVFLAGRTNGTHVPGVVRRWRERFGEPTKSSEEECDDGSGLIDVRWQRDGILWDISFDGTCPEAISSYSVVLLDQKRLPPTSAHEK